MWAKFAMEKQGRMKGYGMDYSMKIVKEIYKSQVYCVKNKTFINFALEREKEINMVIARLIKEKLPSIPAGVVFIINFYQL